LFSMRHAAPATSGKLRSCRSAEPSIRSPKTCLQVCLSLRPVLRTVRRLRRARGAPRRSLTGGRLRRARGCARGIDRIRGA
jgi:hypothetical protein